DKNFPPLPTQKARQRKTRVRSDVTKIRSAKEAGTVASLLALPDELLLDILAYLPCLDLEHFQLPALINLSLTNRRLHGLVSSKLYAAYNSFFCKPYPFLRTVISDRHLAKKVRSLTFNYGSGVHCERESYHSSVSDKKIIKEGLKELEIPGWKSWATDCNDDGVEQELLYATILMHTPDVTSLDIDDGSVSYKTPKWLELIRWAVSGARFGHMHQFSRLNSIRIHVAHLKLRHLAPVFRLPSLREFQIIGLIEIGQRKGRADSLRRLIPTGASSIEALSLRSSFVNIDILSVLLNSVRTLKRFEYQHSEDRYLSLGDGEEYCLVKSLHRHRRCLESLSLGEDISDEDNTEVLHSAFGSLRDFDKLAHLEAPLPGFIDVRLGAQAALVENLPPSLETFCIVIGWDSREHKCMPALEQMATYCRDFVPLLKKVRIEVQPPSRLFRYDWDRIRKPFSEQGVGVIVERVAEDDDSW
ncbi:hypothetical protein BU26DRAFT_400333, partial [Trematosphaeria pertusa]